jgi:NAD(P)H-nitrite reductase large subunit
MSSVKRESIIIVGNGVAGNTAMESIRRHKPSARVSMLSDEPFPLYSACVLSQYVSGQLARERTFLKTMYHYRGVETRLGKTVTGIDLNDRSVKVGREKLYFDKLILATGGEAVKPPIEGMRGPGVFVLKTIKDADELARCEATDGVVVGSGPTGIEVAVALRKRGLRVSLVELLDSVLPMVFDKEAGIRIVRILEKNGVRVITGEKVTRIVRKRGLVQAVETDRRKIGCQMVVWTVGVKPRTDLARAAGIVTGTLGGVQVTERMETNQPGVYACGDCAEFVDPIDKRSYLQLFWLNARQMGRVAGSICAGLVTSYAPVQPGTVLDLFGHTVASIGVTSTGRGGENGTRVIEREAGSVYSRVVTRGGSLAAAQFVGGLAEAGPIAVLIRAGFPLERLPEHMRTHPVASRCGWLTEG